MPALRDKDPSIIVSDWISEKFMQYPELWRVLGIASSTVGLICYALSSSFKQLYGEPDASSAISNAAITLTAVCFSEQIGHKYKVGVSTFFLGCLMIQATKINLILTAVAVAYGYIVFALLSPVTDSEDSTERAGSRQPLLHSQETDEVQAEQQLSTKSEAESSLAGKEAESSLAGRKAGKKAVGSSLKMGMEAV